MRRAVNCKAVVADYCEFLDDRLRFETSTTLDFDLLLPTRFLLTMGDPSYMSKLRLEPAHTDALIPSIRANGIQNPIELRYDENGTVKIQDGYHRMMAQAQLGQIWCPVRLEPTVAPTRGWSLQIIGIPGYGHLVPSVLKMIALTEQQL